MKIKLSDIEEGRLNLEQTEALQNYFKKGGTWADLLELSPSGVEAIYRRGYDFYNTQDYEKAMAAFAALIQLDPYRAKHWIAAGATLQAQNHWAEAMATYELALAIERENPEALFYSAQCAWARQEEEKALDFLERIIKGDRESRFYLLAKEILAFIQKSGDS